MRISIITGEYPPQEGGVGDFTRELSRAWHAQQHEVHILTTRTGQPQITTEDGYHVHRLMPHWKWGCWHRINRWLDTIRPEAVNIQFQAAAYQMQGHILLYPWYLRSYGGHITLYPWMGHAREVPLVITYHDLLPPYLFPKAGPLRPWVVQKMAQHADGVIVTNHGDYAKMTTRRNKHQPPLRQIPIGSNIAPTPPAGYTPAQWRAAHGFSPDDLLISFFGFRNRSKGIATLIQAVAQLIHAGHPAHLIFIGGRTGSSDATNTAYANEIDTLITHLNIATRVHNTGFCTPPDVSAALLAADICALPYRDGASLWRGTLHAALVHGCTIVTTTPQDGTPELRDGENVALVPPADTSALAATLAALWRDPAQRARLSQNAATLAQTFSWDTIAAQTVAFFEELQGQGEVRK